MNRWQKVFIEKNGEEFKGCREYNLLEQIGKTVLVKFPYHEKLFLITEYDCNIPQCIIDVENLIPNLKHWFDMEYVVLSDGQKMVDSDKEIPDGFHKCEYCGNLVPGKNEEKLCNDCREIFGHRYFFEL